MYVASHIRIFALANVIQTNGSALWEERVWGLLNASDVFFIDGVMSEVACESNGKCDNDQMSFKAYLSRWMAATTKMAPFTYDIVISKLRSSAAAAAQQCSGGSNGRTCGLKWTDGPVWDGTYGVGQQMSALEVIQSTLITEVKAPVTNTTGGTSVGNPNAGSGSITSSSEFDTYVTTTGDRVGAGFLTTFVLVAVVGGAWWVIS
jgi:mannan endo-1,6-alpha-mannosidase